jgi:hypothetical protein
MNNCVNISKDLSDRIENYIRKFSCSISEDKMVIKDFEDEMKINLKSSIVELIGSGNSEEEAFKIAISRFGEINQIQNELTGIFRVQRRFQRNILIVAIISLLISAIAFVSYKVFHDNFSLMLPKELQVAVEDKLKTGENISNEEVTKILTKYKSKFRYIALFKGNNESSINTVYPSNFPVEEVQNHNNDFLGTNIISADGTNWSIRYGFDISGFHLKIPSTLLKIATILFATYWILFGAWGSICVFKAKRLSLAWVIMFLTLNVLAYIIFKIDCKVNLKLKMA